MIRRACTTSPAAPAGRRGGCGWPKRDAKPVAPFAHADSPDRRNRSHLSRRGPHPASYGAMNAGDASSPPGFSIRLPGRASFIFRPDPSYLGNISQAVQVGSDTGFRRDGRRRRVDHPPFRITVANQFLRRRQGNGAGGIGYGGICRRVARCGHLGRSGRSGFHTVTQIIQAERMMHQSPPAVALARPAFFPLGRLKHTIEYFLKFSRLIQLEHVSPTKNNCSLRTGRRAVIRRTSGVVRGEQYKRRPPGGQMNPRSFKAHNRLDFAFCNQICEFLSQFANGVSGRKKRPGECPGRLGEGE